MASQLNPRLERRHALFIFLMTLLCTVYVFPRWADPNQNSRLDMVVAVVEDGSFQIDRLVSNTVDYAKVGDHYYSDKAPGAAFLAIPVYGVMLPVLKSPLLVGLTDKLANHDAFAGTLRETGSGVSADKVRFALAQVVLSAWVAALPTALLAALLYLAAALLTAAVWPRVAVALGYALLTPAFAYANAFYGHQLAAALLFGAFVLALWLPAAGSRGARGVRMALRMAAIGALLAFAIVTEYPAALPAALIALYTVWRLWQASAGMAGGARAARLLWLGAAAASGVLVLAFWMLYNRAVFGAPLELGYSYSELWVDEHSTGFMSLGLPSIAALWGISFSAFRGLFPLAPWLLLAVPGFVLWWQARRSRAEWWLSLGVVASMVLFNGSSAMWWGGFAVGPRYLLPALPWLALPVVLVLARWGHRPAMKLAAGLLALWSLVGVWGMTLAEQAFPSDQIRNPWVGHLLRHWSTGNVARNAGTVVGLDGAASLLPLLLAAALLALIWWWATRAPAAAQPMAAAAASGSGAPSIVERVESSHAG